MYIICSVIFSEFKKILKHFFQSNCINLFNKLCITLKLNYIYEPETEIHIINFNCYITGICKIYFILVNETILCLQYWQEIYGGVHLFILPLNLSIVFEVFMSSTSRLLVKAPKFVVDSLPKYTESIFFSKKMIVTCETKDRVICRLTKLINYCKRVPF